MTSEKRAKRHLYGEARPTTPQNLEALMAWLGAEEVAIENGDPVPSPEEAMAGWPVTLNPQEPDTVGLQIRFYKDGEDGPGTTPRLFDTAIAVFLRLATMFDEKGKPNISAYVSLGETKRANGSVQSYPRLTIAIPGKKDWNIPVNRITEDAVKGPHTKPRDPKEYRDCRRRNLKREFPQPPFKPGQKTQKTAVEALMDLYRAVYSGVPDARRIMSEAEYGAAIRRALDLAYRREALRRTTLV